MNSNLSLVILICGLALTMSCKKDSSSPLTPVPPADSSSATEWIGGKIISYEGPGGNVEQWTVNSGLSDSVCSGGNYSALVPKNDFSIQFVKDGSGREVLMGFSHPGQTDHNISPESTIKALVLSFSDMSWLSADAKIQLMQKLPGSSKFQEAVDQLRGDLSSGKALFDTTSTEFMHKMAALYEAAALLRPASGPKSVNIIRAGKSLTFQNPGMPFRHVIGVYKGGTCISTLELGRYQFFAANIGELTSGVFNPPDPIQQTYTMVSDGEYEFRIRTGRPFKGVNDAESRNAFINNATDFVLDNTVPFLRLFSLSQPCITAIRTTTVETISGLTSILNTSEDNQKKLLRIIYRVSKSVLDYVDAAVSCKEKTPKAGSGFLGLTGKLFTWLEASGAVLNSGNMLIRFFSTEAQQDTCMKVTGSLVEKCGNCSGTVKDYDGHVYQIVSIGTQCWMKENLRTSRFRNGDPIPTGLVDTSWANTRKAAFAFPNNQPSRDSLFGKLYNWYAVKDSRNLCPAGWHVPDNTEWAALETFLGGSFSAGGKMKAVSPLWIGDNTGATNESGFTALPAGSRNYDGIYANTGYVADWWSKSEENSFWGYYRQVTVGGTELGLTSNEKTRGHSVRCLKD